MAAIAWYNVTAVAPETVAVNSATQTAILAAVERQVNEKMWGKFAPDGKAYLAAHLATLALRRGTGALTGESVGAMSQSYAQLQSVMGSLGTTPYGAEYLRLVKLLPAALGAVFRGC